MGGQQVKWIPSSVIATGRRQAVLHGGMLDGRIHDLGHDWNSTLWVAVPNIPIRVSPWDTDKAVEVVTIAQLKYVARYDRFGRAARDMNGHFVFQFVSIEGLQAS